MRQKTNIKWNDEWILSNRDKYYLHTEFHKAYCEEVDNVTYIAFKSHIRRKFNFNSQATWTNDEKAFIRYNFPRMGGLKCSEAFKQKFGKCRSHRSIEAEARRQGLLVDEDVVLANKNYSRRVPIGTIVDDGDGYLKIKTGVGSSGWERLHRHIYEKEHGSIPEGYKIVFLDGNKQNYDKDNLVAVPSSYLALMNNFKLKSSEPEVTKTAIKWCDLYELLKKEEIIMED